MPIQGHLSQGRPRPISRTNRTMSCVIKPTTDLFVQGTVSVCRSDRSCLSQAWSGLSQTPSRPECFLFICFSCPICGGGKRVRGFFFQNHVAMLQITWAAAEIHYENSCQSRFSAVYLVVVCFMKGTLRKYRQLPISFCRRVSRFWGVSDKSGAFLFLPCSHSKPLLRWFQARGNSPIFFSSFFFVSNGKETTKKQGFLILAEPGKEGTAQKKARNSLER